MRVVVIGDLHIEESAIQEIKGNLGEILQYGKADVCVQIGDFFNSNRPTPMELAFGTEIIAKFKKLYKRIIILSGTGKHDWLHDVSVIEYMKYLGVEVKGTEYAEKIDEFNCLFGHFMTNKSKMEYGTAKYTLKQLKDKYDIVILGHQHQPQVLYKDKKIILHLGSIRYQHWNEVNDKAKQFAILEDGKIKLIDLKNPVRMVDTYTPEELETIKPKTKVRLVVTKWEDYKNWVNDFSKWQKKFVEFKVKKEYGQPNLEEIKKLSKTSKTLQQFVAQWFKKIKEKEIVKLLKEKFKEEEII